MNGPLLIGYDGTEGAERAIEEGLRLAGELGTGVVLAYCKHFNPVGGEVQDFAHVLDEHARSTLARGAARAEAAGVPVRTELADGRARDALPELARTTAARMIVVGATPHRLLGRSPVPVLVVP
jgi:nucleotide-binding universal stress UspA family protein